MVRSDQSRFLNDLDIQKRGTIKVASSMLPGTKDATSHADVQKLFKTFEHSPDVNKKTLQEYQERAKFSKDPKSVAEEFVTSLGKNKKTMSIATVKSLRQYGVFKMAGRGVYEDLETGNFWQMSADKKHVVRLFKEDDKGIADKRASSDDEIVKIANEMPEVTEKEIINLSSDEEIIRIAAELPEINLSEIDA